MINTPNQKRDDDHAKRVISLAEFCSRYGVGKTTCYGEISSGRLKTFTRGRRRLIRVDDAENWANPDMAFPSLDRKAH